MRFLIVLVVLAVATGACAGVESNVVQVPPIEDLDAVIEQPATELVASPDVFFVTEEQTALLAERALDVQQVGEIQESVSPDGVTRTATGFFNYQVPGRYGEPAGIGLAASCSLHCYCDGACDCEMDGCQPVSGGCSTFGCTGPTCRGHCNYAGNGSGDIMTLMELGIEVEPLPLPFPIGPGPRPIE